MDEKNRQYNKTIDKDNPLNQAWSSFSQKNIVDAESACRKHLDTKRFDSNGWALLGLIEQSKGKHLKAVHCFRAALGYGPDLHAIHYSLSVSLRLVGKHEEALEHIELAVIKNSHIQNYQREYGIILFNLGRYDEAETYLSESLVDNPSQHINYYYLGKIAQIRKSFLVAVDYYTESTNFSSTYILAYIAKAEALIELDEISKALNVYRNVLNIFNNDVRILLKCSSLLFILGRLSQAADLVKKAIRIEPGNIEAHVLLGKIILSLGNIEQAEQLFNKALMMQPKEPNAEVALAVLLERKGDISGAKKIVDKIKTKIPDHPQLLMLLARLQNENSGREEVVELITHRLSKNLTISRDARAQLLFSKGTLLDRLGETKAAFTSFSEGNKLRKNARIFDRNKLVEEFEALKALFTSDFFVNAPISKNLLKPNMIFIVGMPRSGTSLVEQILAAHPKVSGVGEQLLFGRMVDQWFEKEVENKQIHYSKILQEIDPIVLEKKANYYHQGLPKIQGTPDFIVDKMPYNFMHIGLLSLVFPDSKIIHCTRNPLDIILSCYFQDFAEGNSFSYDLNDAAWFYNEYDSLMKHWKNVVNIKIYNNSYESLVSDPETKIRQLLEFCGLEFEESCLRFNKNQRVVHTASYQQVREPIYKRSVEKWKKYESYISEIIPLVTLN